LINEIEKLKTLLPLINHKQKMISFISDLDAGFSIRDSRNRNSIGEKIYTLENLEKKINMMVEVIFSCFHPNYFEIPNEYYELKMNVEEEIEEFKIYNRIFDDILFEVFFNIRKHYYLEIEKAIRKDNKLIINIYLYNKEIKFENNFYSKIENPKSKKRLESDVRMRHKTKGLNLIYSISKELYGRGCEIDTIEDKFVIVVPIK